MHACTQTTLRLNYDVGCITESDIMPGDGGVHFQHPADLDEGMNTLSLYYMYIYRLPYWCMFDRAKFLNCNISFSDMPEEELPDSDSELPARASAARGRKKGSYFFSTRIRFILITSQLLW